MEIAPGFGAQRVLESLNRVLPKGMEVLEAVEIPLKSESLSVILDTTRYRVTVPDGIAPDLREKAEAFLRLETFPHSRLKKGKSIEIDLRRELVELAASGNSLEMLVRRGKPVEFAAAITGVAEKNLSCMRIEKLAVCFREAVPDKSAKTCVGD